VQQPHILILGANFAGLGSAQAIRRYAGGAARITVLDRKDYLLYVPNIPADVFENRDPGLNQVLPLRSVFAEDGIDFVQAEILEINVDTRQVTARPNERPGTPPTTFDYDYLVVAVGNHLAFDHIEGYRQHGHPLRHLRGQPAAPIPARVLQWQAHRYRIGALSSGRRGPARSAADPARPRCTTGAEGAGQRHRAVGRPAGLVEGV
jgi:NADPH-dependent 2,4-dienoyl-CoA reductase/sulfur reductase-like enzyme